MCAGPSLEGPAVVAYADTLIRADFTIDPSADAQIWVKKVEHPEAYGVVQLDEKQHHYRIGRKTPRICFRSSGYRHLLF